MTDTIDKTIDVADKTLNLFEKVGDALVKGVNDFGPDAVNLTLEVARVMAIKDVVTSIITLIAVIISAVLFCRHLKRVDTSELSGVICILTGFFCVLVSIPMFYNITKVHAWIGIFHPELYLAYGIVEKLL